MAFWELIIYLVFVLFLSPLLLILDSKISIMSKQNL
jgi:hypothetical protein